MTGYGSSRPETAAGMARDVVQWTRKSSDDLASRILDYRFLTTDERMTPTRPRRGGNCCRVVSPLEYFQTMPRVGVPHADRLTG